MSSMPSSTRVTSRRPDAPGGKHDRPAERGPYPVATALTNDVKGYPAGCSVCAGENVENQCVLEDLDTRIITHRLQRRDQRSRNLCPGRVSACVGDAIAVVAALASQSYLTVRRTVEICS